jgi:hypothetical protein
LLSKVTFDEDAHELVVALPGRRQYAYADVSLELFRQLCRAASPGKFYNDEIKGRFACRTVGVPKRYRPD